MEIYVKRPKGSRSIFTYPNGDKVNLLGEDIKQIIPANHNEVEKKVTILGATQEQLREIYDNPDKYGSWPNLLGEREVVKTTKKKDSGS